MMAMINKLAATALLLVLAPAAGAAEYVIDGSGGGMHTSVNFRASHLGISSLWGRFNDVSGRFTYDAGDVSAAQLSVVIDPASLDTNHLERDTHLRSSDYVDVAAFPEAGFVSTMIHDLGDGKMHITGNFTLHGVTREIAFEAVRTGEGETQFGDYRVGFEGQTTLDTAEYGINGGMLTLFLAIEGIRQ